MILASGFINAQDNNALIEPVEYVYKTIGSDSLKAYVFFPVDKQKGREISSNSNIPWWWLGEWEEPSWGVWVGAQPVWSQMGFVAISVQYRISRSRIGYPN